MATETIGSLEMAWLISKEKDTHLIWGDGYLLNRSAGYLITGGVGYLVTSGVPSNIRCLYLFYSLFFIFLMFFWVGGARPKNTINASSKISLPPFGSGGRSGGQGGGIFDDLVIFFCWDSPPSKKKKLKNI